MKGIGLNPTGQQIGLLDFLVLEGIAGAKYGAQWVDETKAPLAGKPVNTVDVMAFTETIMGFGVNAVMGGGMGARAGLNLFSHGLPEASLALVKVAKSVLNKGTTTTPPATGTQSARNAVNNYRNLANRGLPDVRQTSVPNMAGTGMGVPAGSGYQASQFT